VAGSGSAPSRDVIEARDLLNELLEAAYGSAEGARAAVERALHIAKRAAFPPSVPELLTFVRAGLLPVLSEDLGPRLAMTVLDDFIAKQEIRSGVRTKEATSTPPRGTPVGRISVRPRGAVEPRRLRVLLVDADRVGRSALARALVRESCQVTAVGSLDELGQFVRSGEDLDVAVIDDRHPSRLLAMETVVDRFPGVSLVVRSAGEGATRTLIGALGVARFAVLPGHASSEELVEAVLEVAPAR
jgi:hypothetical protein